MNREAKLDEVYSEFERNIVLIGATAVEDLYSGGGTPQSDVFDLWLPCATRSRGMAHVFFFVCVCVCVSRGAAR